ncbi:MAG: capsule biosynthesis protein [Planctomycetota bacterium]
MIKKQVKKILRNTFGYGLHPSWKKMLRKDALQWEFAQAGAKYGTKILLATSTGGYAPGTVVESMLAVALTLRGAQVHILLCDKFLPACMRAEFHQFPDLKEFSLHGPSRLCRTCFAPADKMYRSLDVTVHQYSDLVTHKEIQEAQKLSLTIPYAEISSYKLDELALGEHAMAGALRFYAQGDIDGAPYVETILRRYFYASLLTFHATSRLFNTFKFVTACFHHGIYVPQGIIGEVARQRSVNVVNWNPAYKKQCFIFTHGDTYHHKLLDEPTTNWENIEWTPEIESDILSYLKSRWQGTQDWIWFHKNPCEEITKIAAKLGVDFSKPCIGMLTNVIWDAQLHYRANAFPNMIDWTISTINYFAKRPDLQLIIRIHPAEIRGTIPSRQPLLFEIQKTFPNLPANVFIIPPESEISTYAVMFKCNAVIIYGTKTGVELSSRGMPVIVAGEAWIRGKELTMDASSPKEYFELLNRLPLSDGLSANDTQRALKYAYHFFFRRMIPLFFITPQPGDWPPYRLALTNLEELLPGKSLGLDVICDGILTGSEFIYPAEKVLRKNQSQIQGKPRL